MPRQYTDRRRFMLEVGSVLLLLPASRVIAACGGTESAAPAPATVITFTSSRVDDHDHTVQLGTNDLASPNAAGDSLVTSRAARHAHLVELTRAELEAIEAGEVVTKTTSRTKNHAHVFTFVKGASAQPSASPPPPTPTPY